MVVPERGDAGIVPLTVAEHHQGFHPVLLDSRSGRQTRECQMHPGGLTHPRVGRCQQNDGACICWILGQRGLQEPDSLREIDVVEVVGGLARQAAPVWPARIFHRPGQPPPSLRPTPTGLGRRRRPLEPHPPFLWL